MNKSGLSEKAAEDCKQSPGLPADLLVRMNVVWEKRANTVRKEWRGRPYNNTAMPGPQH